MSTTKFQLTVNLDPAVRDWNSDGATFRVSVRTGETKTTVGELQVNKETARFGWVHGMADLQPWAGQSVNVTIQSEAGPSGDITDDWYGWADMAFTTVEAATYTPLHPQRRMIELWRAAGQFPGKFMDYRNQAHAAGQSESAANWQRRIGQFADQ